MKLRPALCVALVAMAAYACSSSSSSPADGGASDGAADGSIDTGVSTTRPDSSNGDNDGGGDASSAETGGDTGADTACTPTGVDYAGCVEADAGGEAGVGNTFIDFGANDGDIAFGDVLGEIYQPKCVKIKAGHTITWNGDFSAHPLMSAPCNPPGGDAIPSVNAGTTPQPVTFNTPGIYGYYCLFHGGSFPNSSIMNGVIVVY